MEQVKTANVSASTTASSVATDPQAAAHPKGIKLIFHLFGQRKFVAHRLVGLSFLIQWTISMFMYFYNYEWYSKSFLVWSQPLTGCIQTMTAIFYFKFLPKNDDPGYYSDKSVMSYFFVIENLFFSGLLLFQALYMDDRFYGTFQNLYIIENVMVFLPYAVIRPFFPKTRFRDSLKQSEKNKSDKNRVFFIIFTHITKVFYIWAKHYMGFYLNYLRFLDKFNEQQIKNVYYMIALSGFPVTVAMFLHTLKFKKYMGPKLAFSIYAASYMATFYSFYLISDVFLQEMNVTLLTFIGVFINLLGTKYSAVYQIFVMIMLNQQKFGKLPYIEQYLGVQQI